MSPAKTIMTYKSNAKLMISGEYLVLKGAEALAIPLKFGQTLKVSEHSGSPSLAWKTYVKGQHWFDAIVRDREYKRFSDCPKPEGNIDGSKKTTTGVPGEKYKI
jgi:hypothetical protein